MIFALASEIMAVCSSGLKCYALRLKPGDKLVAGLQKFVSENKLRAAFIMTCVGSVSKATLRLAHTGSLEHGSNKKITLQDHHEIVSLVGTIFAMGDHTRHLHISLSNKDGTTIGGHLFEATIFTTAEIVLGELENLEFSRPIDDATGYDELTVQQRY